MGWLLPQRFRDQQQSLRAFVSAGGNDSSMRPDESSKENTSVRPQVMLAIQISLRASLVPMKCTPLPEESSSAPLTPLFHAPYCDKSNSADNTLARLSSSLAVLDLGREHNAESLQQVYNRRGRQHDDKVAIRISSDAPSFCRRPPSRREKVCNLPSGILSLVASQDADLTSQGEMIDQYMKEGRIIPVRFDYNNINLLNSKQVEITARLLKQAIDKDKSEKLRD